MRCVPHRPRRLGDPIGVVHRGRANRVRFPQERAHRGRKAGRGMPPDAANSARSPPERHSDVNLRHTDTSPTRQGVLAGPDPAWAPLGIPVFRALWVAALAAYIAFWMQTVAGAWLMASMHSSALLVALMQTAATLPMFLMSLPAGVLADLSNRRHLILVSQAVIFFAMLALGVLTLADAVGPIGLLALTFLAGSGLALSGPAWQSAMSESVPLAQLPQALTLVGIAYNIARAVGPAVAGALQAFSGPGVVFLANAAAYAAAFAIVWRWRSPPATHHLPPERLVSGMRTGLRYAFHSGAVSAPLIRTAAFMLPASGLWALLPVIGQSQLGVSAAGYGLLIGSLGVGAIMAGLAMPWVRRRLPLGRTVVVTTVLYALVCILVGSLSTLWQLCLVLIAGGAAWSLALTLLNAALLTSVPTWVRSRTIALNLLVTQGAMAAGGALWGAVASRIASDRALMVAGVAMLLAMAWARRYPVRLGEARDVTITSVELEPGLSDAAPAEAGPVAVEIRYRLAPGRREEFLAASDAVGAIRRRNGARFWRVYRDLSDDACFMERFIVDSWIDYQRQLARRTVADQQAEARLAACQREAVPILTGHYLAER